MTTRWTTIAVAALLLAPAAAGAQSAAGAAQGPLAEAAFDAQFRKYTPPRDDFSPFYSFDASLGLNITLMRRGPHAVDFVAVVESVGTESLGSRIGVGGTGYVIGFDYTRSIGGRLALAAGVQHLSTHLTRDLDQKTVEVRGAGGPIPGTDDRTEGNAVFLRVTRAFPTARFQPSVGVTVDPLTFELNGASAGYVRPFYVTSRWSFWSHADRTLALETEHEVGHNAYNGFTLRLEMFRRNQSQGRLALLLAAAPGHHLHVSPNIGGRRDGVAFGFDLRFKS